MSRLPLLPAREIVHALVRAGFQVVGQKGSHIKMRLEDPSGARTAIVPNYGEVPRGVLVSILRQAKLSRAEFIRLL